MNRNVFAAGACILMLAGFSVHSHPRPPGSISGIVYEHDGRNKSPLPGAFVQCMGRNGNATTTTDASGRYRCSVQQGSYYVVQASAPDHTRERRGALASKAHHNFVLATGPAYAAYVDRASALERGRLCTEAMQLSDTLAVGIACRQR
jgi:Carboxypeptidase regulatory-like domain